MKRLIFSLLLCTLFTCTGAKTLEVVYRIVEYNADNAEFILAPCGEIPTGASAWFENDYGATYGNRYNQIPRNRQAALHLEGWQGCTVKTLVFSMCSNIKSGTIGYSIADGETVLATQRAVDFCSEDWYGEWVSKDLGVYVDIAKAQDIPALTTDECTITLKAGTPEGSVYINAITIEYEAPDDMQTQSPLGWQFVRIQKKDKIEDGEEFMIFRNGCAATDFDGMSTSHYLDAVPTNATTNVQLSDILIFTTNKDESGYWTLTDQSDRRLGAKAKQSLAWDEGNTLWSITLDYDGAIITSSNTNYGTIRFNAPEGSYARFWNYTSTSLPLPYLYKKDKQNEPVLTRTLSLPSDELLVSLDLDSVIGLRTEIYPKNTTDQRIEWSSSNTNVATVDCGYVRLLSAGETVITARTVDNGTEAQIRLIVTGTTNVESADGKTSSNRTRKFIKNKRIIIEKDHRQYSVDGLY